MDNIAIVDLIEKGGLILSLLAIAFYRAKAQTAQSKLAVVQVDDKAKDAVAAVAKSEEGKASVDVIDSFLASGPGPTDPPSGAGSGP